MTWQTWKNRAKLVGTEAFTIGANLLIPTSIGAMVGYFPTLFFGPIAMPLTYVGVGVGLVYGCARTVGYLTHTANLRTAWERAAAPSPEEVVISTVGMMIRRDLYDAQPHDPVDPALLEWGYRGSGLGVDPEITIYIRPDSRLGEQAGHGGVMRIDTKKVANEVDLFSELDYDDIRILWIRIANRLRTEPYLLPGLKATPREDGAVEIDFHRF